VASYRVCLNRSAVRELEDVGPKADRQRILERIRALADEPRPRGSEKLAGRADRLRIRQGDYRVLYSVDDESRSVTVVKIGHRKDVYRHGA
jgi:mRNA interferase RelE/StbE